MEQESLGSRQAFPINSHQAGKRKLKKKKRKRVGREGREEARRKACLFKQPQLPATVSQQQRQSALQISYAVPGPSSADARGLLPALLGKAKSTRACFRGRFKPHTHSPSLVRATTLNVIWQEPGKLLPIRCSLQKNPIYFPAFLHQQSQCFTLSHCAPCLDALFYPYPLAVLLFHDEGWARESFIPILRKVGSSAVSIAGKKQFLLQYYGPGEDGAG